MVKDGCVLRCDAVYSGSREPTICVFLLSQMQMTLTTEAAKLSDTSVYRCQSRRRHTKYVCNQRFTTAFLRGPPEDETTKCPRNCLQTSKFINQREVFPHLLIYMI